jgi:hypothetical protein
VDGVKPDWLAQLSPSHAPPPAGWWPLAPGWWVLALLTLVALVVAWLWWRSPRLRLRRAALRELAQLEKTAPNDGELARGLEHLVRRYAVARFGRDAVAGLSGARWLAFVAAHGGSDWSGDAGSALLQAAYGGRFQSERGRWLAGARAFFKTRT